MRAFECESELVVLARRRALTGTETMALRAHLVECDACRLAQQVAEDFRQEPVATSDDGAAVLRMSEAARRWARQHDGPRLAPGLVERRPMRVMAMAACALLIAGTVSAFWLWRRPQVAESPSKSSTTAPAFPQARPTAPAPVPPPAPPTAAAPVSPPAPPTAAAPVSPPAPPTAVAPVSPPAPESSLPSQPSSEQPASPALSATLLLQRANDARRRGDISQAITLYRRLQQLFPTSSEAVLSAVPLGGLLLEQGSARQALTQFDRYLRNAPAGVLVPEALYGRGRALRALGNATEERRTWRRLIDAFPDSPYAPLARRRLASQQ